MPSTIEMMLDGLTWVPVKEMREPSPGGMDLPFTTHEGVLELMGHKMRCYRLSDGRTVISADDFEAFMAASVTFEGAAE